MPDHGDPPIEPVVRRALLALLLGGLAALCVTVIHPFIVPILWAVILAYASWPAYRRVRRALRERQTWAALTMTLVVLMALVVPLAWLARLLLDEVADAVRQAHAYAAGGSIALSGVLAEQVDVVTAAYRPWFDIALTAAREGWGLIGGRRLAD